MLKKFQTYLFVALVSAGFAFALGFHARGVVFEARGAKEVKVVRAQDAGELAQVLVKNRIIDEQIDQSRALTRSVLDRVAQTPLIAKEPHVKVVYQKETVLECESDPRLTVGAVGLLNDARSGAPDQSPSASDEARAAASVTRLSGLVRSDIEVAGAYRELMVRHNELVDYVEGLMAGQRERLGSKIP